MFLFKSLSDIYAEGPLCLLMQWSHIAHSSSQLLFELFHFSSHVKQQNKLYIYFQNKQPDFLIWCQNVFRNSFAATLRTLCGCKDFSPVSTGSTAHPEALAASHWTGSCCAGELQSSDWPMSGPHDDRTGGDPAWGLGMEGTLLMKR